MKISRLCRLPKAGPACLNDGPHQRSINQAEACTAASQCTASLVGGCRGLEVRCSAEQRRYRRLRAPETITPPHVIAHNTRRCTCQCASSASANAHAVVARLRRFACTLGRRDMPTRMGAWRDARHCNAAPTRARTVPFDVGEAFVVLLLPSSGRQSGVAMMRQTIYGALQAVERGWWAEGCLINNSDKARD